MQLSHKRLAANRVTRTPTRAHRASPKQANKRGMQPEKSAGCHTDPIFPTKQRTYKNRRSRLDAPRTQKMAPNNPINGSDAVAIARRKPGFSIRANPCSPAVKGFDFCLFRKGDILRFRPMPVTNSRRRFQTVGAIALLSLLTLLWTRSPLASAAPARFRQIRQALLCGQLHRLPQHRYRRRRRPRRPARRIL